MGNCGSPFPKKFPQLSQTKLRVLNGLRYVIEQTNYSSSFVPRNE